MNNLTWHCELVIKNDQDCNCETECMVSHVMNRVYHDRHGQAYSDQKKVRIYKLSEFLRNYVEELTDYGNEYGRHRNQMTEELICGALQEIDFREIAENLIGDYSPKSPAEVAEDEEFFEIMGFGNYDIDED